MAETFSESGFGGFEFSAEKKRIPYGGNPYADYNTDSAVDNATSAAEEEGPHTMSLDQFTSMFSHNDEQGETREENHSNVLDEFFNQNTEEVQQAEQTAQSEQFVQSEQFAQPEQMGQSDNLAAVDATNSYAQQMNSMNQMNPMNTASAMNSMDQMNAMNQMNNMNQMGSMNGFGQQMNNMDQMNAMNQMNNMNQMGSMNGFGQQMGNMNGVNQMANMGQMGGMNAFGQQMNNMNQMANMNAMNQMNNMNQMGNMNGFGQHMGSMNGMDQMNAMNQMGNMGQMGGMNGFGQHMGSMNGMDQMNAMNQMNNMGQSYGQQMGSMSGLGGGTHSAPTSQYGEDQFGNPIQQKQDKLSTFSDDSSAGFYADASYGYGVSSYGTGEMKNAGSGFYPESNIDGALNGEFGSGAYSNNDQYVPTAVFECPKSKISDSISNDELINAIFGKVRLENYVNPVDDSIEAYIAEINKLTKDGESIFQYTAYRELSHLGEVVNVSSDEVFGLVLEVGVDDNRVDTVAAYEDGRVRYLGCDGKGILWEPEIDLITEDAKNAVKEGETVFLNTREWYDERKIGLSRGYIRFSTLTAGGLKILEGEYEKAMQVPQFAHLINSMMKIMKAVKDKNA